MKKIVHCSVSDLRREKTMEPLFKGKHDRRRDSQLLLGTYVTVLEEDDVWAFVEVSSQMCGHAENHVRPYRGYVLQEALSHITIPEVFTKRKGEIDRGALIEEASSYIGQPYLWGGMSIHLPDYGLCKTGIDCSGLVYMAYFRQGIILPRDAKDQYVFCVKIPVQNVQKGDLLFRAKKDAPISHVMLYDGKSCIEAVENPGLVRKIDFEERFGFPIEGYKPTEELLLFAGRII